MKAICNVYHPLLIGIFDKGDEVDIVPILSDKDSYKGFKMKSKNGNNYDDKYFTHIFGLRITLADMFIKA